MLNLTITNRSQWPDWFLEPVCKWIAHRALITWRYELTVKGTTSLSRRRGMGWRTGSNVSYHRRNRKGFGKDHRFQWAPDNQIPGGIPALVFLVAHEMYHATGGHPDKYRLPGGRTNADLMEFRCNEWGRQTMEAFRAEWPAFRALMLSRLRRERRRTKDRELREVHAAIIKATPAARIEARALRLKVWERKLKLAQTKVVKLRRSIRAIERRAAMSGK